MKALKYRTVEIIKNNVNSYLYHQGDYISLERKIERAINNRTEIYPIVKKICYSN